MTNLNISNDDFESILICAVRYCIGRKTYMPELVIHAIIPVLPEVTDKTLWCLEKDVDYARKNDLLGDAKIDAPIWIDFLERVAKEKQTRWNRND